MDNIKAKAVGIAGGVASLILSPNSAKANHDYNEHRSDLEEHVDNNDWHFATSYSDATTVEKASFSDSYDTVQVNQAGTLGWNYDNGRSGGSYSTSPQSMNHNIDVQVAYSPSDLRATDPLPYDNNEDNEPDGVTKWAIDYMWDLVSDQAVLPVPDPFALVEAGTRDSDADTYDNAEAIEFTFPDVTGYQGGDWLWHVEKPVEEGTYCINVEANGTAYQNKCSQSGWAGGCSKDNKSGYSYMNINDFEVYRS